MRGWHERSDILSKKSGIDTLQEDILKSSGRYGGASGSCFCLGKRFCWKLQAVSGGWCFYYWQRGKREGASFLLRKVVVLFREVRRGAFGGEGFWQTGREKEEPFEKDSELSAYRRRSRELQPKTPSWRRGFQVWLLWLSRALSFFMSLMCHSLWLLLCLLGCCALMFISLIFEEFAAFLMSYPRKHLPS